MSPRRTVELIRIVSKSPRPMTVRQILRALPVKLRSDVRSVQRDLSTIRSWRLGLTVDRSEKPYRWHWDARKA